MVKSKELILVRYISFFILMIQLLQDKNKSVIALLFILLFIINNNLRIFYYKKESSIVFSIVVEIIAVITAQINLGGNIIFYLIGITIDLYSLKNNMTKYILGIVVLCITIASVFYSHMENRLINLVIIGIFSILLSYIARLYSTKIEAQKLYDRLRVSENKLVEANSELEEYINSIEEITVLKERNRISREIHDSVGHALSTAIIQLSAMEAIADKEKSMLKDMISNLKIFINESFQDVKRAVRELKPDEYNNYQGILRIQEVCKNFEKMTGVTVKLNISKGNWNLSTKQVSELYRITQECLSNSLRHGNASMIRIMMNFTEDEFIISFNDNGKGTDKIIESGVGLKSIKERSTELNGTSYFKSNIGKGFFVKIIIPKEVEV